MARTQEDDDGVWEDYDELASSEPERAWTLLLEIISRSNEDDLSMIGAGALTGLLAEHPQKFADRFKEQILSNDRFFRAFQYAVMTGVPLTIQRPLNAALLEKGADPKFVVEYDEEFE